MLDETIVLEIGAHVDEVVVMEREVVKKMDNISIVVEIHISSSSSTVRMLIPSKTRMKLHGHCFFLSIFNTIFRKSALGLGKTHLDVGLRKTWKVEVSNSKREMLNFLLM